MNYFFHTYVTGYCNMKVQNAFLTKFMIMKLRMDTFSIFSIFLSSFFFKYSTKEFINRLFRNATRI